jgi:centromeric protein E
MTKSNSKQKEAKGNVLVSVRVRPDGNGGDTSRTQGEWSVDGRQSLISYRGKEGGDYYYGECQHLKFKWSSEI